MRRGRGEGGGGEAGAEDLEGAVIPNEVGRGPPRRNPSGGDFGRAEAGCSVTAPGILRRPNGEIAAAAKQPRDDNLGREGVRRGIGEGGKGCGGDGVKGCGGDGVKGCGGDGVKI